MVHTTHFELRLLPGRKVLAEKIIGFWTGDIAHAYVQEVRNLAASLIEDDWAMFTDLSEWRTSKPEIIDIIGEQLSWQMAHNMRFNVNVIPQAMERLQFRRMIEAAGEEFSLVCSVHATLDAADEHLRLKGF